MWKNEKFSHLKIFRQINSLVTYLVKPLLSRNFCQKCMRGNSRNFHTVLLYVWVLHSVEKYFVKWTLFRNFFQGINIIFTKFLFKCMNNFRTVLRVQRGKMEDLLSQKNISSNQCSSNFFSRHYFHEIFTKITCVIVNFRNFHTVLRVSNLPITSKYKTRRRASLEVFYGKSAYPINYYTFQLSTTLRYSLGTENWKVLTIFH